MKILHMISNWKWTGPAEPAVNLCRILMDRHETTLVCGRPPADGIKDDIYSKGLERGVSILKGLALRKHFNLKDNVLDVFKLRGVQKRSGFDLIHVHMQNDHLLAGLARAGLKPRPPIVRTFYGAEGPDRSFRSGLLLRRFTDGAIAISASGKERITRVFRFPEDRSDVIPAGVDTDRFDPERLDREEARRNYGLEPRHFLLGIVARVQRHRKFDVLLEAMRQAMAASPDLRMLIVGRGTHREEVAIRPVKELGLEDRILFTGYLEGESYVQALAAMDGALFLVPGSDGSCRAVREKMAMGLPVIATNIPPLNEMITPGETGFLVECTAAGIRDAALGMAGERNGARRMGSNARDRAKKLYSLSEQASRVDAFYRHILDAVSGRGKAHA
jgi:glycosyltransferase involved in cell wall biosynthesis